MNSSVTVSIRSLVTVLAVATALVLAYVVGALQHGAPAAATPAATSTEVAETAEEADAASPTIAMSGTGTATGVPDQLGFSVGVHTVAADVSTALDSASRTTARVMSALQEEGVARGDLKTTGLHINANYDYGDDGPPVITGYSVSQNLSVLVRSLPDAGETLAAAAEAGGNAVRLSGVRLEIGDQDALLAEARDQAIADAEAKARQYAEAGGRSLGEVLLVRETGAPMPVPLQLDDYAAAQRDVRAVPIRAGKADLQAEVSVVWSLT
jgi:uncharacterized protein YggE